MEEKCPVCGEPLDAETMCHRCRESCCGLEWKLERVKQLMEEPE